MRRVERDGFVHEFKYDRLLHSHHTRARVDGSEMVIQVIPHEIVILEKLLAARGAEVGKFDYFDAAGLLATKNFNIMIAQRLIERQRHKITLDSAPVHEDISAGNLELRLRECGIHNPQILDAAARAAIKAQGEHAGNLNGIFSPDALKKLALTSTLLQSLGKLESELDSKLENFGGRISISDHWGKEVTIAGINRLREFLYVYADTSIGRDDIFMRRTAKSLERGKGFFLKNLSGLGAS